MDCRDLQHTLAFDRNARASDAFAEHLRQCEACRRDAGSWQDVEARIADRFRGTHVTEARARALVERARGLAPERAERTRRPWAVLGWSAISALVAAAVVIVWLRPWVDHGPIAAEPANTEPSRGQSAPTWRLRRASGDETVAPETLVSTPVSAPDDQTIVIEAGPDRIGLDRSSRAGLAAIVRGAQRWRIDRGRVVFQVDPRPGRPGFAVDAAGVTVHVVGTVFAVGVDSGGSSAVTVEVTRGRVSVESAAGEHIVVEPGERLVLVPGQEPARATLSADERQATEALIQRPVRTVDAESVPAPELPATPPTPTPANQHADARTDARAAADPLPDLKTIKATLLAGDHEAAIRDLRRTVAANPKQATAWSLLGDAYRKTRRWSESVSAYEQAARVGRGAVANQATLQAAIILQDELGEHDRVVRLLSRYLERGAELASLAAAARLRLARSLLALGRRSEAVPLLRALVEDHADTPFGREARAILSRLRSGD